MTGTTSPWALLRARRPDAPTRLYCFPHSGGSPGEYIRWAQRLPSTEVLGIQLPGRGSRLTEKLFTAVPDLVSALVSEFTFTEPFVFFGHSLGALVAFDTARELRARGLPGPRRLVLSACTPPHHGLQRAPLHVLPDEEFIDALSEQFGGLPPAIRSEPELLGLVLPAYRADLEMFERYEYVPGEPLPCPMTVVGGADDYIPSALLADWQQYTTGGFDLYTLPGGHFYLRDEPAQEQLLRVLARHLEKAR
ncbi:MULTISPECIES: thioesterase II family protein [unclassified Micromonospora]|uniref:thioesterase II family protein n=1 Tax=unclassified Micromonospora TaxID=2617518 RepID=UPI003A844D1F